MQSSRRKTCSDKFPLTLHPTGQYCKKIKGKIRYFGTDKKKALERYLAQATCLHGSQSLTQKTSNGKMTLKQLCDLYLQYQYSRLLAGAITPKHYNDSIDSLGRLMSFLGQSCRIESISTLELQNYKRKLESVYSVDRQNLHISIMKAMFHWASRNDVLETIPNIDAISKQALKELPRSGQLVFYTSQGQPWVTTVIKTNGDGEREYMSVNRFPENSKAFVIALQYAGGLTPR